MEKQPKFQSEFCKFYLESKCRFGDNCRNLHPALPEGATSDAKKDPPAEVKGHSGTADSGPEPPETITEHVILKKSRMRTAQEVINRLLWDPELDPNDYSICYLDRFVGPVQLPLINYQGFEEEPDDRIPQHRIQKILYKDRVVWNKNERMDLVFGSTGHRGTIIDILEGTDQE